MVFNAIITKNLIHSSYSLNYICSNRKGIIFTYY